MNNALRKMFSKFISEKPSALRYSLFVILCSLAALPASAGARETVAASGSHYVEIDDEISPREAMDRAFEAARKDALQRVVGVEVKSWESAVLDSEAGEGFSSLTFQTTQGVIRNFVVKKSGWVIEKLGASSPAGTLRVFCEAEVCVEKLDEKPDPEFACAVAGARADYRDGERVKFSVTPSRDAYLNVFLLNARLGGARVFPNRTFRKNAVKEGEPSALPPFTIMKTKDGVAREQGVLMFVLTKKNVPFFAPPSGVVSADEINAWLADVPADERFFRVFPFSVQGERKADH